MHSGRQCGGEPDCPGKQEHEATFPFTRHWLFGPQGEGLHGFFFSASQTKKMIHNTYSVLHLKEIFIFLQYFFSLKLI